MGFTNIVVMIPFCRSPDKADRVLEVMAENGLTPRPGWRTVSLMGCFGLSLYARTPKGDFLC